VTLKKGFSLGSDLVEEEKMSLNANLTLWDFATNKEATFNKRFNNYLINV